MGCMRTDLLGKTYGYLTIVKDLGLVKQQHRNKTLHYWLCECVCGKKVELYQDVFVRKSYPVKSCGCKQHKIGAEHHQWTGCGEISGNRWDHIKRVRRNPDRVFTISIEEAWELFLKQNRKCALSGLELFFGKKGKDKSTATLDRIDSKKGYTIDNVQWIHKDVNWMKNAFEQNYFIDMCRKVVENVNKL